MDVSSGAAVAALLGDDDDVVKDLGSRDRDRDRDVPFRILDLCCAPGLKTCAMVDRMMASAKLPFPPLSFRGGNRHVVVDGVDVSSERVSLCRNIVHKYLIDTDTCGTHDSNVGISGDHNHGDNHGHTLSDCGIRIRLFRGDGRTFGLGSETLVFDSPIAVEEEVHKNHKMQSQIQSQSQKQSQSQSQSQRPQPSPGKKRKRTNKSARARERTKLKASAESYHTEQRNDPRLHPRERYDRVLVDAECSTDGAIRHWTAHSHPKLPKSTSSSPQRLLRAPPPKAPKYTTPDQLADLVALQKGLLDAGFRSLKPGGRMVYSTCSLSHDQNEAVVAWLLHTHAPRAVLLPVRFPDASPRYVTEGSLPGTVRFLPRDAAPEVETATDHLYGGGFFLAQLGKRTTSDVDVNVNVNVDLSNSQRF